MFFIAALLVFLGLKEEAKPQPPAPAAVRKEKTMLLPAKKSDEAVRMELLGLVSARDFAPTLAVQLAYATHQNLLQVQLYHNFNEAYLQKEAAQKLAAAQQIIKSINPDLSIIVR
ncbi:MAG: hypothetical protein LBU92_02705, partial [Prevotellaceae bacterium]|nr:hypothetical protein [Prevotellaceae bacterium]